MTADELIDRLEQAGKTLIAWRTRGLFPASHRSAWPEHRQELVDIYGAIIGSENPEEAAREIADQRLKARVQPTAAQLQDMDRCLDMVMLVDAGVRRRIVFARMLVDPITDRHIASWRKLGRVTGLHKDTVQRYHNDGIEQILRSVRCAA